MAVLLVGVLLDLEGKEKMDMVESEVEAMVGKADGVVTMEVLLDQWTLAVLGVSLAVNGGVASDFQTVVDFEVVAEVPGEAIDLSGRPRYSSLGNLSGRDRGGSVWIPKPSLVGIATMHSRCLPQEPDSRPKQVPKKPSSLVEKADPSHSMFNRHRKEGWSS